jgi:small-conductance mechanosensitive channel
VESRMTAIVDSIKDSPWLLPAIFVGSGLVLGIFIDHVVLPILMKLASKTKWKFDDIIIGSLRGLFIVWFGVLGAHLAIVNVADKNVIGPKTFDNANAGLKIIFVGTLAILASRIAVALLQRYIQKSGKAIPGVSMFTNLTRGVILVIGALMILKELGYEITPLLTALGVGGLAVALALQPTLSNLFAGLHMIVSGQIKPGDYIRLDDGNEGYVSDITWRNTTIKALANNMIIVPNSKLASATITNYYQPDSETEIGIEVSVRQDSDLGKVQRVTLEVAKEIRAKIPGLINTGEPSFKCSSFSGGKITFNVGFRVKEFTDQYSVKHEFLIAIHKRYGEESIQLA